MKVTEIEVHDITLTYVDWIAYQLNHYHGPARHTVYVSHTDKRAGRSRGMPRPPAAGGGG